MFEKPKLAKNQKKPKLIFIKFCLFGVSNVYIIENIRLFDISNSFLEFSHAEIENIFENSVDSCRSLLENGYSFFDTLINYLYHHITTRTYIIYHFLTLLKTFMTN